MNGHQKKSQRSLSTQDGDILERNVPEQPLLGNSIPPKVVDQIIGEVLLQIHCIEWIGEYNRLFSQNICLVSARWWGENAGSPCLFPPNKSNNDQFLAQSKIRFPITCPEEKLANYFENATALPLNVCISNERNASSFVGQTVVALHGVDKNHPIDARWYAIILDNGVTAGRLKISMHVKYFQLIGQQSDVVAAPSIPTPNLTPILLSLPQQQERIRANRTKTDLHSRQKTVNIPITKQLRTDGVSQKDTIVAEPNIHEPKVTTPIENIDLAHTKVDTAKTISNQLIDDLLSAAESLDHDLKSYNVNGEQDNSSPNTKDETINIDLTDSIIAGLNDKTRLNYQENWQQAMNDKDAQSNIVVDDSFSPSISNDSSRSNSPEMDDIEVQPMEESKDSIKSFLEYEKRVSQKARSDQKGPNIRKVDENDHCSVQNKNKLEESEEEEPIDTKSDDTKSEESNDSSGSEEKEHGEHEDLVSDQKNSRKKVKRHRHTHFHIRNPQYRILLHVMNGRLCSSSSAQIYRVHGKSVILRYKVSLDKRPETRVITRCDLYYDKSTMINKYELILLDDLEPQDFVHKMAQQSLVMELRNEDDHSYLGVLPLSLRPFYDSFSHYRYDQDDDSEDVNPLYLNRDADMPVVGFHGIGIVKNPLTDESVARFNILLAFGTKGQISRLVKVQMAALRIQYHFRRWLHSRALKGRNNRIRENPPFVEISATASHIQDIKEEKIEKKGQEFHEEVEPIAYKDGDSDTDDDARIIHELRKERHIPDHIPLGHHARLTVRIIRATGLQQAAQSALQTVTEKWKKSSMEMSCQIGVNAFTEYENLLPQDEETLDEEIYFTGPIARSFCPKWQHENKIDFVFDEAVYSHFSQAEAIFKVCHRIPMDRVVEHGDTLNEESDKRYALVVPLAECRIPLFPLIKSRNGITGWHTLNNIRDGNAVGAIEISIQLDDLTKEYLFPDSVHEYQHKSIIETLPMDVCRFTIVVEEIFVPMVTLKSLVPLQYLGKENFPCRYTISYRFYDKERIESRPYVSSSTVRKLTLNHTTEQKRIMDSAFVNQLMCEKLSIDLHVRIGDEDDNRKKDDQKYLGTAYVDMSQLMYKRQASNKGTVLISGVYTLINPESTNLSNGYVRVKVMCETLSKNATLEYMEKIGYRNRLRRRQFHGDSEEDSDFEEDSEPEITMDEFDSRHHIIDEEKGQEQLTSSVRRIRVVEIKTESPRISPSLQSSEMKTREISSNVEQKIQPTTQQDEQVNTGNSIQEESCDRVEVINQLHICIQRAYHLPLITTTWSARPILPSCFVKILTFRDDFEAGKHCVPNTMTGSFAAHRLIDDIDSANIRDISPVVHDNCNPEWNYHTVVPLTRQIDSIVFQVWHKAIKDKLIGECVVDMSGLMYGLDRIDGWYHLESRNPVRGHGINQPIAQIKVSISPEKPYSMIYRSSPTSVPLQQYGNHREHAVDEDFELVDSSILSDSHTPTLLASAQEEINHVLEEHVDDEEELIQKLKTKLNELDEMIATVTLEQHHQQ